MNINISENLLIIENFRQKSIENSRLGNMDEFQELGLLLISMEKKHCKN